MLVASLVTQLAAAAPVHALVAAPADWSDPSVRDRVARMLEPGVVVGPAIDLVQPGRVVEGVDPGAQPGRVTDRELRRLAVALERAEDAGDCEGLLAVADRVVFVDRRTVRELRFSALLAAGLCGREAGLDGPRWTVDLAGERASVPLAHAVALGTRDPALLARVDGEARVAIDEVRLALEAAPTRALEVGDAHEVWLDGLPTEPDPETGTIALAWGRADVQLVRTDAGTSAWSASTTVEPGAAPVRPQTIADEMARQLVAELPTDGGQRFADSVGAYAGLVDAGTVYLVVPERRRLVLWRWLPDEGRFEEERGPGLLPFAF